MGKETATIERPQEPVLFQAEAITLGGQSRPDFKIFTRGMEILKDSDDEDSKRRIRCIASSSVKDLHGDTMTAHCIRSMAKQASGLTIFLNHSYRAPEDIFGMVEKARTKTVPAMEAKAKGWIDKDSTSNEDVVLLQLDIILSEGQRIDDVHKHVQNGVTLGVSIGANITDYEEDPDWDGNGWWPPFIINDVDLLEASIVGIPANPLSWVEGAAKGLITKGAFPGVTEDMFQSARRAAVKKAANDGWEDPNTPGTKKKADPVVESDNPQASETKTAEPYLGKADGPEDIVTHYQAQVEDGTRSRTDLDALQDDVQKSIDFALANGVDESIFEGRTAADFAKEILATLPSADEAEENTVEKSADNPGKDEEAQESGPDSSDEGSEEKQDEAEAAKAAETEMTKLAEAGTLKSADDMVEVIEDLLKRNALMAAHNERLVSAKATLLEERDTAAFNAEAAVKLVREVMEIPLARKSAPIERAVASGAEKLKGKLSDELLNILYPPEE